MTDKAQPKNVFQNPAVGNYLILALAALLVLLLALLRRGLGGWSFLPILVGALGIGLRWRSAAIVFLILTAGLLFYDESMMTGRMRRQVARSFHLEDWMLSGAILGYVAAFYRVLGLTVSIFPRDPRRADAARQSRGRLARWPAGGAQVRASRLVPAAEIGWLILALPIWALLAQVCSRLLPRTSERYGLEPRQWQGILAAWLLMLVLFVVRGLLRYVALQRLSRPEAALLLQDALWQETNRDQRRVARWQAWAALRRRRKETS